MRRRCLLRVAGLAAIGLALARGAGATAPDCPAPAELLSVTARLPHLAATLHAKRPVTIVAIGGNSTRGIAAGSTDLAYPNRLQAALSRDYPDLPINVINKGVARQTAQQMLERFPRDVFAERPALVVWEAGISDAVRGIEIDDFAAALEAGIDAAKQRQIDIVLVDMQFSRRASTVINFEQYRDALYRIGDLNGVYVFPRFEIMRYWSEQNIFDFDAVQERERAGFAARVYDCLGRRLADAIRTAVE
jgi:acyl-CoA thioesterase I